MHLNPLNAGSGRPSQAPAADIPAGLDDLPVSQALYSRALQTRAGSSAQPQRRPSAAPDVHPVPTHALTIARKLSLLLGGLLVTIVVSLSVFFQHKQSEALRTDLQRKATTYAQLVAAQVRSAVAFEDQETVREVFDSIATDPDLASATLYTDGGNLLYSWGQPGLVARKAHLGVDQAHVFELSDRFLSVTPVVSLEGPSGTLALEFSKQNLFRSVESTRATALLISALALGLGITLAAVIAQSFARRLRVIALAAESVAEGNLTGSPIVDRTRDEIGSLSLSFNAMLRQLKALLSDIKSNAAQEQARLEGLVLERTSKLAERNDDMRRVLDSVDQGFLTIDREGKMSLERSAIIQAWLGAAAEGGSLWDYLDQASPGLGAQLEVCWDEVIEDVMPLELTLAQMPGRFETGGTQLSLVYKPIFEADGSFQRTLVVISDITAILDRKRVERDEQEITQLFSRVLSDAAGVVEFLFESNNLVAEIVNDEHDLTLTKRRLHTLKGNSAIFGLGSIAELCHSIEDALVESGGGVSPNAAQELLQAWQRISSKLSLLLGDERHPNIKVDDEDYREILSAIADGTSRDEIQSMIRAWRLEATQVRLKRLGEQAHAIAARLGKGPIEVRIESNRLRLDAERWKSFWAEAPHLIRNAIDHGMETVEERLAAGKPGTPTLRLRTRLSDDNFVIEVADDGRGVDWPKVREACIARGMKHATQQDLEAALFADGLSTRTTVTEASGRGVGMGALRAAVEQLAGRIELASSSATGTCVRMLWPAVLASGPLTPAISAHRFSLAVGLKWAGGRVENHG